MRMFSLAAGALLVASCAAVETPAVDLDADPNSLQIEIGRYSALLGQVVEHTGVAYDHKGAGDAVPEGAPALMADLEAAVADYNAVRAALCASKAGARTYAAIRVQSCGAQFRPAWKAAPITHALVARRSSEAGEPIIGLWSDVCDEARRLQPKAQEDEPVCPME